MAAKKKKRRDGSGSVFQDKHGNWIAQIRRYDVLQGRSKQIRRRARSRDHARELLAELKATGGSPTRSGVSLAEYLANWRDDTLPVQDRAESTKSNYRQCLTYFGIPAAGQIPLTDFTPSLAEQWIGALRATRKLGKKDSVSGTRLRDGDPISPNTVRNTYMVVRTALDDAVRDGLMVTNPLTEVTAPRATKTAVPVTRPDEVEALLVACSRRRIEPLVYFVAFTGCRIGEALSLRWEDVDLKASTATVWRGSQNGHTTKSRRPRSLTLLPEVTAQLKAVRQRTRRERLALGAEWWPSDLVFTSATGRPLDYNNVSHELQRALRAAGVSTRRPWHSLRHGVSHRLLTNGLPLPLVSSMLGHSSVAITADIYGHVDSRIPVDLLEQTFNRVQHSQER